MRTTQHIGAGLALAAVLATGRFAAGRDAWGDGPANEQDASAPERVASRETDLAALGVQGDGAPNVARAIKQAFTNAPAGAKVRFSVGEQTTGDGRARYLYLRSLVLLDAQGQPDGLEMIVTNMGLTRPQGKRFIPWKHGVKDGVERETQEDRLAAEIPWQNGQIEGTRRTYFPSGQPEAETEYVHGLANGSTRVFDESGALVREGTMKAGRREGALTEYWAPTKQVKRVAQYRHGKAEGPLREYYQSGKLKREATLQDDALCGEETQYSEAGAVTLTRYWLHGESVTAEEFRKGGRK